MATVILRNAKSFHHAGVKFVENKPKPVSEEIARELEDFPQYFEILYGDEPVQPVARRGGVKIKKKAVEPEPEADSEGEGDDEPAVTL